MLTAYARISSKYMNDPYRDRAIARPIEGPYKDLAVEIRRLLGWTSASDRPFISTRAASRKTGLSNVTINAMAQGDKTSSESIEKFVQGIGGDKIHMMVLAGHLSTADLKGELESAFAQIVYAPIVEELQRARYDGGWGEDDDQDVAKYIRERREAKARKQGRAD